MPSTSSGRFRTISVEQVECHRGVMVRVSGMYTDRRRLYGIREKGWSGPCELDAPVFPAARKAAAKLVASLARHGPLAVLRAPLSLSLSTLYKTPCGFPCSPLAPNPLALEPNALFGEKCAAAPARPLSRVGARLPRPRLQPLPSRRFRHRKPCLLTPLRVPQL